MPAYRRLWCMKMLCRNSHMCRPNEECLLSIEILLHTIFVGIKPIYGNRNIEWKEITFHVDFRGINNDFHCIEMLRRSSFDSNIAYKAKKRNEKTLQQKENKKIIIVNIVRAVLNQMWKANVCLLWFWRTKYENKRELLHFMQYMCMSISTVRFFFFFIICWVCWFCTYLRDSRQ